MIPDLWWNNKCRRYAEKLGKVLDDNPRAGKTNVQIHQVMMELEKASKSLVDGYAHNYLVELDDKLYKKQFTNKARSLIEKAIS